MTAGASAAYARADHVHPAQTSVTGNAGTATKLATPRMIMITGQVGGQAYFDGSGNITLDVNVRKGGSTALNNTTDYTSNSAWGNAALQQVTTGQANVGVGCYAGQNITTGVYNTCVGYTAGPHILTGSQNIAVGAYALGSGSGVKNHNVAIGYAALRYATTGHTNVAVGGSALYSLTTGSQNVVIGAEALEYLTTGYYNTAIGYIAGLFVGGTTSYNTNPTNSIFIGRRTDAQANAQDNQIVIGNNAIGGGSNSITLGNSSMTKLRCQVTAITALSDRRIKEEIEPADLDICLDAVKSLPVHRYKYKDFTGKHLDTHVTGWLADDVETVFPKAVQRANQYFPVLDGAGKPIMETVTEQMRDGEDAAGNPVYKEVSRESEKRFLMEDVKDITMTEALPTLWGAVQRLAAIVEAQAARIEILEGGLAL
jgi:hypothetical protein